MNKLEKAIALTDEILEILDNGDFDKVAEIEVERAPLIRQAFGETIEQIDQIKASHLYRLNQQVVDRLQDLKQSVFRQQQQIRKAAIATQAYTKTQYDTSGMLVSG